MTAVPTTTACPRCATEAVAGDRFCEVCGADLAVRRADPADHVEITVDGAAAVGNRGHVRARNEDAVALGRTDGARVPDRVAAVVCDGVSSTRSSQLAARAAADAALDALLGDHGDEHDVRSAVAAGAAAAAALAPRGTPAPPSCTLVCGVRDSGVLTVAWVGDSRAYWLAEPGAAEPSTLLTADHTAAAAAAAGTLDPAIAAARGPARSRAGRATAASGAACGRYFHSPSVHSSSAPGPAGVRAATSGSASPSPPSQRVIASGRAAAIAGSRVPAAAAAAAVWSATAGPTGSASPEPRSPRPC